MSYLPCKPSNFAYWLNFVCFQHSEAETLNQICQFICVLVLLILIYLQYEAFKKDRRIRCIDLTINQSNQTYCVFTLLQIRWLILFIFNALVFVVLQIIMFQQSSNYVKNFKVLECNATPQLSSPWSQMDYIQETVE